MREDDGLARQFEEHRALLHAIAHRMLGSAGDAADAVQETWLKLAHVNAPAIDNLGGWLRTALSRVCLDMLRSRAARREDLVGTPTEDVAAGSDPERDALLADSVGRALLVVLDTLGPAERIAFVLHDMFAVPFEQIAPIVDRSTVAAKKLASRARNRVRGTPAVSDGELARHRRLVEAFLAASRAGDMDAVLAVLAPDVVRRADRAALPPGRATEIHGAHAVAGEVAVFGRNARFADLALVNGDVGIVVAPRGRLLLALVLAVEHDRVAGYELVGDPARLRQLRLAVLGG